MANRLLALLACLSIIVAFWIAIVTCATGESSPSPRSKSKLSVLSVPVSSFKVEDTDMENALRVLRATDVSDVVIGFERVPHPSDEKGKLMSLHLVSTTVGEVIKRLCQMDTRYEYGIVDKRIAEVRPTGSLRNTYDLLNMHVNEYRVDKHLLPGAAIEFIDQDASELRSFLREKAEEQANKTGIYPASPGSIMTGNMTPPLFSLQLHNVTVRQILNSIALKSIKMFQEGKNYGPVGWEYDFIIDPNAPTGLGGYPKWTAF